jgi:two-component system chemotaxis response regulator CheY
MDITMPEMTGLEALKEINKIDPKAKVVMVSAMGQEAMVREAIMSGAKGFIVKPFKEDGIIAAISKLA